jgi:hypothetical protein
VRAGRTIEEHRVADPHGDVEIVNVAGAVEIAGWDRDEVQVSGTADDDVERVDVTCTGSHTSIHVVVRSNSHWGSAGAARLTVHVPAGSAIRATLVSADLGLTGTRGDAELQTVSGNVHGDVGGNIKLTAHAAKLACSSIPRAATCACATRGRRAAARRAPRWCCPT